MNINTCLTKIDNYFDKEYVQPLIVDVQNRADLSDLITRYNVGSNKFISAIEFCNTDEYPRLDSLLNIISHENGHCFVTELSIFLKLKGEQELRFALKDILGMNILGHVVVITYQCKQFLNFHDPRLNSRICVIDGDEDRMPDLVFVAEGLELPYHDMVIRGINNISNVIETKDCKKLYVRTEKHRDSFPNSLLSISNITNAFDILAQQDNILQNLNDSLGTPDEWNYALNKMNGQVGWDSFIDSEFGNHNTLDIAIPSYKSFDDNRKWLFFVALKLYGAKNNWCLNLASQRANSIDDFLRQVYRSLLDVAPSNEKFKECYASRKELLIQLGNPIDEVIDYCNIVLVKGENAIWYLTDNTQKEREVIFALIDKYSAEYARKELLSILELIYPALYAYLMPYRFDNDLLDKYFQDYKYQKVINHISPKFEKIVTDQAEKREYNLILEPRSSKIETINRDDAQLYFVDAMGVEYLSYIMSVCKALSLLAKVSICKCELPSITSRNKEFIDLFAGTGLPIVNIKDLDDIKHHGKDNFDYQQTKLPIHLAKELDILKDILTKIKEKLAGATIKKAIIISDHGASRLAVIHETETIWEMPLKGKFSGRCCLKSDVDIQPAYATDAGDFWALANYDRFKGSRKASVEAHGGATLEEVTVPIIELTNMPAAVEVHILPIDEEYIKSDQIPEIEVSYKKKAALKIFATMTLQNVSICIDEQFYECTPVDNNFYVVEMPDIKKAKTYNVDVYSENNLIAEGLPLIVKKEGARERDIL